jgi:DNA repair protein RecO (recombination protein O)
MTSRATCGFVLKVAEHGESDKLVTLYSPHLGRVPGIAKGALKSRRRFVNKLEAFSQLRIQYQPPRRTTGLYLISEAELLNAHLPLRFDYRRYVVALHFCELLLRFTRENDPDPRLYFLLQWTLAALCEAKSPHSVVVLAHLHLLGVTGYCPELDHCGGCGRPLTPECRYTFRPSTGSLLCTTCHPFPPESRRQLSIQTLRLLLNAQTTPLERLGRIHLSRTNIIEALDVLYVYTLHLLQQDIHSWEMFRSLAA